MNYNDFIKALGDLHHDAEFCLMDVSERISVGDKTVEFLITEDTGYDKIGRRGGKQAYRTRVYICCPGTANSRIEVNDSSRAGLDRATIDSWGISIHEMFIFSPAPFEGAYFSLKQKIKTLGESSQSLLEAAMGEEMTRLITARLLGEEVSADIRNMLNRHIQQIITDKVGPEVKTVSAKSDMTKLGIRKDDGLSWEFDREGVSNDFSLIIRWKSLHYGYQSRNQNAWLVNQEVAYFCVRDAFLFSVNLPAFGGQITNMIEKVNKA